MPHAVCPHATRKRRPKLALSLRTHTRTSVLDLMEMPDLHQLHLLGLALAWGSCISVSARSRWSRTERGLRPPLLALAGLDEAPQGLQECWCAQEVKVRSLRRAGAAARAEPAARPLTTDAVHTREGSGRLGRHVTLESCVRVYFQSPWCCPLVPFPASRLLAPFLNRLSDRLCCVH